MLASKAAVQVCLFRHVGEILSAVTDGEPEIRINAGQGTTEARPRDPQSRSTSPLGN